MRRKLREENFPVPATPPVINLPHRFPGASSKASSGTRIERRNMARTEMLRRRLCALPRSRKTGACRESAGCGRAVPAKRIGEARSTGDTLIGKISPAGGAEVRISHV
ncbi:unnamed protein product [Victoria cruziana]